MLKQLVEYSAERQLIGLGFAPKMVKWAIVVDREGRLCGVEQINSESGTHNSGREFSACPDLSQSELVAGKEKRSHFLVDSIATVLGTNIGSKSESDRTEKHEFFIRLLREAAEVCPETALFADCLEDGRSVRAIVEQLKLLGAKSTDKITIRFREHNPQFLLEDTSWHSWWSAYRKSLAKPPRRKKTSRMVSFISGEAVEPARTHPKITGLSDVGAAKTGAAVVSCDKDSLCSYGLTQSLNSAMSEEEAAAYRAGLNHLLANHGYRIASTKIGYAYRSPIPEKDNPMRMILNPLGTPAGEEDAEPETEEDMARAERSAIEEAERLMAAIETGERSELGKQRYFSLALSGNAGRVVVRDWTEGRFDELLNNALAWFADLAIVRYDGVSLAPPPKLGAVLASLARRLKDVPAPLAAAIWRAATCRQSIPREVLARAVDRFRADVAAERRLNHARVGLMKAALLRMRTPMGEYVNEYHPSPAYHCGRFIAVVTEAASVSLDRPAVGCGRRYFATASIAPASSMKHVLDDFYFHLHRLFDPCRDVQSRSFGVRLQEDAKAIFEEIRDGGGVPGPMPLEDRCRFALGYYQQRALLARRLIVGNCALKSPVLERTPVS